MAKKPQDREHTPPGRAPGQVTRHQQSVAQDIGRGEQLGDREQREQREERLRRPSGSDLSQARQEECGDELAALAGAGKK